MDFLLSNDDGYQAPGLSALADILKDLGKVTVFAPDRDRSGASNSLTLDRPLHIDQDHRGFYYVDGTPTDCVHLAINGLLEHEPDMVISGINAGANLGDDVLYSGTVAAAMEGRFLGCPSLAFSLVQGKKNGTYTKQALLAKDIIELVLNSENIPRDILLNVNFPNHIRSNVQYAITRLGNRHRAEQVQALSDSVKEKVYRIGPAGPEQDASEGTDFYAIKNGQISITPLQVDLTQYQYLSELQYSFNIR